jgi:hypothetical protein
VLSRTLWIGKSKVYSRKQISEQALIKKPLLKEEVRYNNYITSHLPDLTLPELAPGFQQPGCRGIIGPVPTPLWIRAFLLFNWTGYIMQITGCQGVCINVPYKYLTGWKRIGMLLLPKE